MATHQALHDVALFACLLEMRKLVSEYGYDIMATFL